MSGMTPKTVHPTVQGVQEYIREHGLKTGDMMPSETALCEELGCSRSSLREAMRTLSTLDIVEIRHGYGTFVSKMSLEPLVHGMVLRLLLDPTESMVNLAQVVQTREALDLSLADELVEIYRGAETPELDEVLQKMRQAHARGEKFAEEDQRFHRLLLAPIANPIIRELTDAFWQIHNQVVSLLNLRELTHVEDIEDTIEAHEDTVKALVDGDADAYRKMVVAYYRPLRLAIERAK